MKKEQRPRRSGLVIFFAVLLILLVVVMWHLLVPFLGVSVALAGALWTVVVSSVAALVICMVLFFVMTGLGIFILGLLVLIWTVVAIVLFPVLFPLLVPLLILMLLIGFLRSSKKEDK